LLELSINDPEQLIKVSHALSSEIRVQIIRLLNKRTMNIVEIAQELKIPVSTAASNIKVLETAELILTELQPARRGSMKVCSRNFDDIHMNINDQVGYNNPKNIYEIEMPVGQFIDCDVVPTCGMANVQGIIKPEDEPGNFFHPDRVTAQIIWFRKGFIKYRFPLAMPPNTYYQAIQFTLELCSEAPSYDNHWPSDITVWINNVEIGTWISPGDFGDRRGKLNPSTWNNGSTQYGLLKTWKVDNNKSTIDDVTISNIRLKDLNLEGQKYVSFKIGVKTDAIHKGGINLFGKQFGDYAQDIVMKVVYE
jgi:predicted transcriptional regulator